MKDIQGYEGLYAIEEDGRVWSFRSERYLNGWVGNDGYKRIMLIKELIKKTYLLHRLIALTYISNPENKPFIDHIDRDRTNNSINNLRWVTSFENNQNLSLYNTNTTGHQNISHTKNKKDFRVTIERNGIVHCKHFKTVEEAIKYRDEYLNTSVRV